jgi:hypothetical protein
LPLQRIGDPPRAAQFAELKLMNVTGAAAPNDDPTHDRTFTNATDATQANAAT